MESGGKQKVMTEAAVSRQYPVSFCLNLVILILVCVLVSISILILYSQANTYTKLNRIGKYQNQEQPKKLKMFITRMFNIVFFFHRDARVLKFAYILIHCRENPGDIFTKTCRFGKHETGGE